MKYLYIVLIFYPYLLERYSELLFTVLPHWLTYKVLIYKHMKHRLYFRHYFAVVKSKCDILILPKISFVNNNLFVILPIILFLGFYEIQ